MNFRLAYEEDLPFIKKMFKEIVCNMERNNLEIWDDVYPCEFFLEDIKKKRLYSMVEENGDIVAVVALCDSHDGADSIQWEEEEGKALYIERFGVNVDYLKKGMGSRMIEYAMEITEKKNMEYLRLFVVDINKPAINIYVKNGFKQVKGIYEEKIDDFILRQYGFEIEI